MDVLKKMLWLIESTGLFYGTYGAAAASIRSIFACDCTFIH